MGEWHAELKGGPFHGEKADIPKLPPRVFVTPCPRCGSHWYDSGGGEIYTLDEVFEDSRATYAWGDLTGGDADIRDEQENRPRELTPA